MVEVNELADREMGVGTDMRGLYCFFICKCAKRIKNVEENRFSRCRVETTDLIIKLFCIFAYVMGLVLS